MMLREATYGDVTALHCSWPRSRAIGYTVHAFLVRGVLIDTAFPGVADQFASWLSARRVRGAFITHAHEDHAGNVGALAARGIPIAADPHTLATVRDPASIAFYRRFAWRAAAPARQALEPFRDASLTLIPTPGHSPDHHAVWDSETGTLFSGDLFIGVKLRLTHRDEDPRAHVASLRAMIARGPSRVFCAHRGLLHNGVDGLRAKAEWMDEAIGRIDEGLAAGVPEHVLRRTVLGQRSFTHYVSRGEYSPDNFVRAVRRTRATATEAESPGTADAPPDHRGHP